MRRYTKTALCLVVLLLCNGCGKKQTADVPELVEPVAVNASYRPVEYGSIGKITVCSGTVVPKDYCHFYEANVEISDIVVEVGDTVEAGDVLAYADVDAARESLQEYQNQLAYENTVYEINQQLSTLRQDKLSYQRTQAQTETEEETEDVTDYDTQIAIEQENTYYDTLLHQYRVANLNEAIARQQAIVEDGTLRARHGGQVTYTKNLADGLTAGANENIVVVSDLSDVHIELTDTNIQEYEFDKYEVKYIMIAGEKVAVTEDGYSSEEKILAEVNRHFPNVRFHCPEGYTFTVGDMYPVYFAKKDIQNVLIVGNDSVYTEGEDSYVYVQNETGEQEKRYVTVGASDENYTQITEGVTEGELVYYHSTARIPSDYTEYTVSLSDFTIQKKGKKFERTQANVFPCFAEYEGEIAEVAVKTGQEISEGDLLYIIDTGEGKAAITEASLAITSENTSYEQSIASLDEQIAAATALTESDGSMTYELQMLNLQKELAVATHEQTVSQLQKNYDRICSGNDGTGKVSIYAPVSGTVSCVDITEGSKPELGSQTLQITTKSSDILCVKMVVEPESKTAYPDSIADVGEMVTIRKGDYTYEGECVGWASGRQNMEKGYVYTDEAGVVHLSYNAIPKDDTPAFYVRMKDDAFFEDEEEGDGANFTCVDMKQVIVVPCELIYSETDPMNVDKTDYYVWRVVDDTLVKQYVLVDSKLAMSGGQVVLSGILPGDVLAQE